MENLPIHLSDLGGGQVDGIPPLDIQDSQFERLVNFFPFGSKLVRRGGVEQKTTIGTDQDITGLLTFSSEGSHYAVAGLVNKFAWNNAGTMTAIPKIDGALPDDYRPWSMVQYKNEMFAVRPGSVLQRLTNASAANAGIQPGARPGANVNTNNPWTATPSPNVPAGRNEATVTTDGTYVYVWGGIDDASGFPVGGIYSPSEDKWFIFPVAGAPPANRYRHTAIFDGTRTVVWGGYDNAAYLGTGSRYNNTTSTWAATTNVGAPSIRSWHTAVWSGTRMLIWGGFDNVTAPNGLLATGGSYDPAGDAWTAITNVGAPAARARHTAVWTGTEMLIWGGIGAGGLAINTGGAYLESGPSWTALSTVNAPAGRVGHTAIWTGTRMIIWGGYDPVSLVWYSDGASYDPVSDTWETIEEIGAPQPRWYHTAVWTGSKMVVWGGRQGSTNLASGGRYDPVLDTWDEVDADNEPSARYLHVATQIGLQMFVFGGTIDDGTTPETGGLYYEAWDGRVTEGQHRYFVTFVTASGNESAESEEVSVTLSGPSTVTLTIPVSLQPHVTKRRLWRTLSDDAGQAYLVATINDNTTTTYVDILADAKLGLPFEYGNRLPPTDPCRMLASWKQRLWLITDNTLHASKTGRFETFDQSFQGFDQYSGHVLRGVAAWDDRLMVGTTKKMFYVVQTGVDESGVRFDIEELSEEHGTVAGMSMQTAEGRFFYFAGDNVYMSTGGKPISITTERVRRLLDRAKARADRWEYAVGSVNTDLGWYMLSLSVDTSDRNDFTIVYNYRTDRWHVFQHFSDLETPSTAPAAMTEYYDSNYARVTYAAFSGKRHLYQLNTGPKDAGTAIRAIAKGKAFQRANQSLVFRKISLNCTSAPEYLTVRLYRDGGSVPASVNERTIYLAQVPPRDWKRVAMSGQNVNSTAPARLKARSFQVEVDYTGDTAIEVNEMILEVDAYTVTRRPL